MKTYKNTNAFGVYLNELLTLKSIDKKHFASLLGINRSQLYRFLNNEQLPEEAVVEEMATILNLYTSEKREMMESYESTLYGWEVVEGRKIIIDIIKEIQNNEKSIEQFIKYIPKFDDVFNIDNTIETRIINGRKNVLNMVFSMLDSLVNQKNNIEVHLLLNPDYVAFMDLLPMLLEKISKADAKIFITHIIRFKEIISKKTKLFNLEILRQLLPLSKYENIYKVFYTSQQGNTNAYTDFYPNFLSIGEGNALFISSDFESALFFGNKANQVVVELIEEYNKVLKDSLQLFINFKNPIDQFEYLKRYEVPLEKFLLHPEQGFYTFPIDVLKSKAAEYDNTEAMGNILKERLKIFKENLEQGKFTEIIPLNTIEAFVNTGKMFIQRDISFTVEERIKILKELLRYVEKEKNYNLYLIKNNNELYRLISAIYSIGTDMLLIIPQYKNYKVTDNIIIRERSIVESFKDFFDSYFKEKNTIIDQSKVAEIIENKIRILQD